VRLIFLSLITLFLNSILVNGQYFDRDEFGKNRIQHKKFEWRYITSNDFEVFYYQGGYEKARLAAQFAEEDLPVITTLFGYTPANKPRLFLYQSVQELRQSNIGINYQQYSTGGLTYFVRNEIEVAYPGTNNEYRIALKRGIARALLFEQLYNGNLREVLQGSFLLRLPEWFSKGIVEYAAEGWSEEMDNWMRTKFDTTKKINPINYEAYDAAKVGQAIFNYIQIRYGKSTIPSIINLTRITHNERKAIENTLGIKYKQFVKDWIQFYKGVYGFETSLKDPNINARVAKNRPGYIYYEPTIHPSGRYVAYVMNKKGRWKVKLYDRLTDKTKTILRGDYKVISQEIDYTMPILAWKDSTKMYMYATKNSKNFLWEHDLNREGLYYRLIKRQKRIFGIYSQINSFDVTQDGDHILLSAEKNGKTDIFVYDWRRRRTDRITSDPYDDITPTFIRGTKNILFASNRMSDSLEVIRYLEPDEMKDNYNIFYYDWDAAKLTMVTDGNFSKTHPHFDQKNNRLYFLDDSTGTTQLAKMDYGSDAFTYVTNYSHGIKDYDINGKLFTPVMSGPESRSELYLFENYDFEQTFDLEETYRRRYLNKTSRSRNAKPRQITINRIQSESVPRPENLDNEKINTEDYTFLPKDQNKGLTLLNRFKRQQNEQDNEFSVTRSILYEPRFTIDFSEMTMVYDPFYGFTALLRSEATDILENHKFLGGGYFDFNNLSTSSYFAEYQYLRNRLDYSFRFERRNLNSQLEGNGFRKNVLNHFIPTVSYPFNIANRLELSVFYANTRTSESITTSSEPDNVENYGGYRLEWVYDNSIILSRNLREGLRMKSSLMTYFNMSNEALNFSKLWFDARYYKNLYRRLIWANRVNYGRFFGQDPKAFYLGGVDNFVTFTGNNKETDPLREDGEVLEDDETDPLFSQFVFPLRGFKQNFQQGRNVFTFSTELRFPIAQFLYRGSISSNFLRNLQFVGFFDAATAWNEVSFLERDTTFVPIREPGTAQSFLKREYLKFADPFLLGTGFGIRTLLQNYYIKIDYAYGIIDRRIKDPYLMVSLGSDF
jgi:Tol biopolymer transport system component